MKMTNTAAALCATALVATSTAFADTGTLRFAGANDRIESLSKARSNEDLVNVNRERVQYSWVLDQDAQLRQQNFEASSRGFQFTVTGEELTRGVALVTDAPGAALHISPARDAARLSEQSLQLTASDGTRHTAATGLRRAVDGATLRAYGIPFESSSLAFELAPVVGAGRLTLQSLQPLSGDDRYVVQVMDRNSTLALTLSAARAVFLENGILRARAALTNNKSTSAMVIAESYLASPEGQRIPVTFDAQGDKVTLNHKLPAAGSVGALWDLHVVAREAGSGVMRNVKTSFAIARPTARFAGNFRSYDVPAAGIGVSFGIEVSDAGRYEVRAVLLGSDQSGALRPAVMASSAAWFQPGTSTIELRFDADKLAATGLTAPFAMIDLQLLDQSRVVALQSLPSRQSLHLGQGAN
ncbi:MAG: DUF4785 domain-containing protein [Pseudomonadota bacterium]